MIYLIESGYDPVASDLEGKEPIDYALENDYTFIVYYLCNHCITSEMMLAPERLKTTLNILRKMLEDNPHHLDWKTADGDSILETVCHSKLMATHMLPKEILKLINHIHEELNNYYTDLDMVPHLICHDQSCVTCVPSEVMLEWLEDTILDPKEIVISCNWKTANGHTLLELVCLSELFLARISSKVMMNWLIISIKDLAFLMPQFKTADGDTLLELVCQSESCVSRISSTVMLEWLEETTLDLKEVVISCNWKTANGDTLFELLCLSELCIMRIPSIVIMKWLNIYTRKNLLKLNLIPHFRTADGDTLLQLLCHFKSCVSSVSSSLMLSWLASTPGQLMLQNVNLKTADGDTLLQLVCQSNSLISRISSTMLKTWLKETDTDLLVSGLHWKTADGVTMTEIIVSVAHYASSSCSFYYGTPIDAIIIPDRKGCYNKVIFRSKESISVILSTELLKWLKATSLDPEKLIIPHWITADGVTLLQLVCQSESIMCRLSSKLVLNWLNDTIFNLNFIEPTYKTTDDDTLLELVCQSKSCVSRISSKVMLKWLNETTYADNVINVIVPNYATADGDTMLNLVCHSESLLSHITSSEIFNWLKCRKFALDGNILSSSKTADGDTLFHFFCGSQFCFSNISSSLMLQWLDDGNEATFNVLKSVKPDWTTSNGDAILHLLCQSNMKDNEVIELLQYYLQESVLNPNIKDSNGDSAIHLACKASKSAIVIFLLTKTMCDINVKNYMGLLPLEMTKSPKIIHYICQNHDVIISTNALEMWLNNTALIDKQAMLKIFELLVHKRKVRTCDGSTLLHISCSNHNIFRDTRFLINYLFNEVHCDPNCMDNNKQTPLECTLDYGMMKELVEHGAKVTSHVVFKIISSVEEHKAIEILLLSSTKKTMLWKPTDLNDDGDTALHLACKVDKPAVVKYLLKQGKCNHNDKNSNNELPIELTTNIDILS